MSKNSIFPYEYCCTEFKLYMEEVREASTGLEKLLRCGKTVIATSISPDGDNCVYVTGNNGMNCNYHSYYPESVNAHRRAVKDHCKEYGIPLPGRLTFIRVGKYYVWLR